METDELIGMDLEHYRVVDRLGEGGMAVVYRARDLHLDRLVAVKVLRLYQVGITAATQGFIKRFEREAHALARLQHPNIVPIIDFGAAGGKFPYLVMPLLTGGTLRDLTGAPLPYPRAAHLLAPVAGALAYAHQAGYIHRDVKPANILLTESGEPMLSDFGIARFVQEESMSLTASGAFIGTPGYMAPEQWQGRVLPQTDIFSLGVAFYELVAGVNPYNAETPNEILYRQLIAPLPDPRQYAPDLPELVVAALQRALAKDPSDRYPSMAEFVSQLRQFASGSQPATGSHPPADRPAPTAPASADAPGRPVTAAPLAAAATAPDWSPVAAGAADASAAEAGGAAVSAPRPDGTLIEPPGVASTASDGREPTLVEPVRPTGAQVDRAGTRIDRPDGSAAGPSTRFDRGLPPGQTTTHPDAAVPPGVRLNPADAALWAEPPRAGLWRKLAWPLSGLGLLLLVAAAAWMILGGRGAIPNQPVSTASAASAAAASAAPASSPAGIAVSGKQNAPGANQPAASGPAAQAQSATPAGTSPPAPPSTKTVPDSPAAAASMPTATATPPPTARPFKPAVLWDSSHGPRVSHEDGIYDPTQLYSKLADLLANTGLTVQNSQQPLPQADLSSIGAVVVNEWSAEGKVYTPTEVDGLVQYVQQGGGLLILAENPDWQQHVAPLAERFGVSVAQKPALDGAALTPGHPITQGVRQLDFLYPGGTLRVPNPAWVVGASADHPAVAAFEQGAGRVVIIGDGNLFDNRAITRADNTQFAVNVFRWLVGQP